MLSSAEDEIFSANEYDKMPTIVRIFIIIIRDGTEIQVSLQLYNIFKTLIWKRCMYM